MEENSVWNKINRLISNKKRRKSYPAVKIGRLAVSKKFANKGIGTMIIETIKEFYKNSYLQYAGCRFIIVDAYKNALPLGCDRSLSETEVNGWGGGFAMQLLVEAYITFAKRLWRRCFSQVLKGIQILDDTVLFSSFYRFFHGIPI